MAEKQKVAILGGGVGSIVAAYELTSTRELRERFQVTVYQAGWRLGGKGASGRNVKPNRGSRIEEHGLHVWFGFYENAFRVMRDAYAELGRTPPAPLADWREAFNPCEEIVLYEEYGGRWIPRNFKTPRNPLTPGEAAENQAPELPDFWQVADELLGYLLGEWRVLESRKPSLASAPGPSRLPFGIDRVPREILGGLLEAALGSGDGGHLAVAHQLARHRAQKGIGGIVEGLLRSLLWRILDDFKVWLWEWVVQPQLDDDDLRFFFTMFDAGSTMLRGIVEDRLIERGFEAVNGEDLRAWMRRHGAQAITVDQGPFVRGLYDMAFAYEQGDIDRPRMAAGTALHDALRLFFTYRGAFAWKMQAGMGDTVFTPFYEVLRKRGVRFEFFHWVSELRLSADRRYVEEIDVIPQARLGRGPASYEPLVPVADLPCWPSEPQWEQIEPVKGLRKFNFEVEANPENNKTLTLRRGEEFDIAVLGISVGALPAICRELIEDPSNRRFAEMIENSRTVMTQAFQLWLNRPPGELGWRFSPNSAACSFVEPLDTYADMSQLLCREQWPPAANVKDIAYFCGVLGDLNGETQAQANARVRAGAIDFLNHSVHWLWPNSATPAGFDWSLLLDPAGNQGEARFDAQFWLANLQPSERYVLTPPGSVSHRLKSEESGYENLFLAGDWTKTGLDAGCVEAAAMSGMQASRAICGVPAVVVGEDDDWLAGPGQRTRPPRQTLPEYVDYGGLATCPSPVNCVDATLYSFFLRADYWQLACLCDKVFANRTGGDVDVCPLLPVVMLTFGKVKQIEPVLPPWSRMGFAEESQVALWIPVAVMADHATLEIGWFVPSMWVDNPLSLAGGREIYGFNKMWGSIDVPDSVPPAKLALEAYGGNYDRTQRAGLYPLIEVDVAGTEGSLATEEPRWRDLADVVADARGALEGSRAELMAALRSRPPTAVAHSGRAEQAIGAQPLPDRVFEAILKQGGPSQFFLRQFRAVNDGRSSCNQQITKSGTTVKRIVGRPISAQCAFKLHRLDSHPIAGELGLRPEQNALAAFVTHMDFVLEDGSPLWEA